jgi:hypothetical protein
MNSYAQIEAEVNAGGLGIVGGFHPGPEDLVETGTQTLLLLGATGPNMWARFSASAEAGDGAEHPMDRWSTRVIRDVAQALGATALFPFGGPPWHPFQKWASLGEGAVVSPVAMQASPTRGLWASYRGALAFDARLPLPEWDRASPCAPCPAPCKTACPVEAFKDGAYDVPRCTAHVRSAEGADCREGCLVRRACPAGRALEFPLAQRRFHMAAFLAAQPL